jgi:signal transduction histidine kinase/AraC-like DNA-binding protein/ligand-binding sensor domain-containing protein
MRLNKPVLCFFILFFIPFVLSNLKALESYSPKTANPILERWRWRHFRELDGTGVKSITEGADGHMWFATNQGVYEYNGYTFRLYDTLQGLIGFPVKDIINTSGNNLYCSTSEGIFLFNGKRWENIFPYSTPSFEIYTIREIENEGIFCLSEIGIIRIIDSNQFQIFTSKDIINKYSDVFHLSIQWITFPDQFFDEVQQRITDIIKDKHGYFWIAIDKGEQGMILKLKSLIEKGVFNTNYKIFSRNGKHHFGSNQKFLETKDNAVWVTSGSYRTGIHIFKNKTDKYIQLSKIFGGDEFHWNIVQNKKGEVMISGIGKFFVYSEGHWDYYSSPNVPIPPSCRIIIYETTDGSLWIGGLQNKIFKLDYTNKEWLTYKNLNYQAESSDGRQWFLESEGKVIVKNGDTWQAYGKEDGLIDAPVRLICTRTDQIWVAGTHDGVAATALLKKNKWVIQKYPALSWGIDYRSVFESGDSSLWFGGAVDSQPEKGQKSGIIRILNPLEKNRKWIHYYYPEHGNMSKNTYGIAQSPDGRIWKGGLGLSYFNGQRWQRLAKPEELTDYVNTVHSRPDCHLYAGSRYYGLYVFDGNEWSVYNTNNGLNSNSIISIYCETDSKIWIATDNGVARFDGHHWTSDIFPDEMNMSMEGGSLFVDKQGYLWINISPREWKRRAFEYSQTPPDIYNKYRTYRYIPDQGRPKTYMQNHPEIIPSAGQITFFWKGKDRFNSTPDNKLQYSYRLDKGAWSDYTFNTNKTYYNLSPGEHVFEVKAQDLDMNIDSSPASAVFLVSPPVWRQTWFILLMTLMISITLFFIVQIIKRDQKLTIANTDLKYANDMLSDQKEKINSQKDQLNKMLVRNEQLSQSRLRFYTNISHEFRTPLTLILGNLENLAATKMDYEKRKAIYSIIRRNTKRILYLINQILEFRKIESGTLQLYTRKGDLARFIENLTSLFKTLAEKKHIRLDFSSQITHAKVYFDHDKIEKIIFNLLSNAFKHCPEEGRIKVELHQSDSHDSNQYSNNGKFFRIVVSDTGKGIKKEEQSHIFERYYTGKGKLNNNHEQSSGIGLSYIKDLVEIHQGKISVDSEPGKGTSFKVYIPILKEPAEGSEKIVDQYIDEYHFSENVHQTIERISKAYTGKFEEKSEFIKKIHTSEKSFNKSFPTLLIVEDNDDMRQFLVSNLSDKYNVFEALNGKQGLEIINNHAFDLVISDVMMPQMDGIQFCKHIKTDINTSHIPVILLTAKSLEEHKIEGYETGADDYIVKPFNKELLLVRIENIIENRKLLKKRFTSEFSFEPKEVKLPSSDQDFLKKLVSIMEENISDSGFNIEIMAKKMFISRSHFIRKVKSLTGQKPLELLVSYRLKRAKQLLCQKEISISEVAYLVGYDNPSSFTRAFKSRFNQSPTAYMNSVISK